MVVDPGPQVHVDLDPEPHDVSWSKGDTVPVKLLRVSSQSDTAAVPSQMTPVASARRGSDDSIEVSWTAVDSVCGQPADGYEIQVSEDGTDWRTLVVDTGSTALSYTHGGLPRGATRYYRVQAGAGPAGTGIGSGFGLSASATVGTGLQVEVAPPSVTGAPAVSPAGPDSLWTEGETVEVTLAFSEAVSVDTANGVPWVGIGLGGPAPTRSAAYLRGSGTAELVFGYTLVEGDGDHGVMFVPLDSLALNGGAIRGVATGADAALGHNGTLVQAAQVKVPGSPFTASFSGAPAEHDGTSPFELQFRLSAEPAGLSYRTVQSGLFDVSGGTIARAWRLQRGKDAGWGLRIQPSGFGDVTLALRATTDCAGTPGVCTADGRMLGGGLQATIAGPPTLSVADAEVREASGAVLDFAVTLSRALAETVTVGYGAADGTARAGADYTNTTGTLTFAAGETSKTVSVPVLDDGHDEGSETMTLTLSNPSPTRVKLRDAEATGTINNTGAMPNAWIASFGRTVADHVLDGVAERMKAPRAAGLSATLGGQALPGMNLSADAAARPAGAETREAEVRAKAISDWLNGETRGLPFTHKSCRDAASDTGCWCGPSG